jgi:hypothetical protein
MSPQAPGPPPPSSATPLHADHSKPSTIPTPRGMSEQQCRVDWWARTGSQPGQDERPIRRALQRKLRTVLWGLSGKPVDDAALEEVARLREALRGDLGEQLCGHVTGREVDALHTRTVALLDNPVVSIPDRRRPIPWSRSDAYVSLSAGSRRSDRAPIVPAIGSVQWPRLGASSRLLRGPAHR